MLTNTIQVVTSFKTGIITQKIRHPINMIFIILLLCKIALTMAVDLNVCLDHKRTPRIDRIDIEGCKSKICEIKENRNLKATITYTARKFTKLNHFQNFISKTYSGYI